MNTRTPAARLSLAAFLLLGLGEADAGQTLDFRRGRSSADFRCLAISPDNRRLVVAAGGRINVVDSATGKVTQQIAESPFVMHFTLKGERLYAICSSKNLLYSGDLLRGYSPQRVAIDGLVGIRVGRVNRRLLVQRVFAGGPVAKLQRVRPGDELVGVGEGRAGRIARVTSEQDAVRRLRGPAGTFVQLQIIHDGAVRPETYVLQRMPGNSAGRRHGVSAPRDPRVAAAAGTLHAG